MGQEQESQGRERFTRREVLQKISTGANLLAIAAVIGVTYETLRELNPPYDPTGQFIAYREGKLRVHDIDIPESTPINLDTKVTKLFPYPSDEDNIPVSKGDIAIFRKPQLTEPIFAKRSEILPVNNYDGLYAAPVFGERYDAQVEGLSFTAPSLHFIIHEDEAFEGGLWFVLMCPPMTPTPDGYANEYYPFCTPNGELLAENENPYYIPSVFVKPIAPTPDIVLI